MSERVDAAERLLDLVIALTHTRRRMTKAEIRRSVNGYDGDASDDAFERMFERDKDALRELGIPIVTLTDPVHEDEIGYRISTSGYELPRIELSPAEMGVLSLAAEVWQDSAFSRSARRGLTKLRAVASDPAQATGGAALRVRAPEPAMGPLLDAITDRVPVRFSYRAANTGLTAGRTVEPWRIYARDRGWYLYAWDRDRGAARSFRLSRIVGRVKRAGEPGQVRPPQDREHPEPGQIAVRLAVRPERAAAVRARASVTGTHGDRDVVELTVSDAEGFADELAGYGDAVLVLDPPHLRAAVLRRLRAALALAPQEGR